MVIPLLLAILYGVRWRVGYMGTCKKFCGGGRASPKGPQIEKKVAERRRYGKKVSNKEKKLQKGPP